MAAATAQELARLEQDWELWLLTLFHEYVSDRRGRLVPFAEHHVEFWDWLWSLQAGVRSRSFIAIWPRGGAKSTSAELACVAVGARRVRKYGLYICSTQDQADDHVSNVGAMLESTNVAEFYPLLAQRLIGKFGNSRGWRRNRLRTSAGFTLDALGLDSAARGVKLEADRPDFMIFDDLDGELDTPETTAKKIKTLTFRLLPAGSSDLTVLAVQNLVSPDSIFSQLADGRAEFLADRIVSGPHPALIGAEFERQDGKWVITEGVPTWAGMDLEICQTKVTDEGLAAFKSECQHDVFDEASGLFRRDWWGRYDPLLPRDAPIVPRYIVIDTAAKDGIHNDFSTAAVWGEADGKLFVLDLWRAKVQYPDLKRAIRDLHSKWRVSLLVEDTSAGQQLIQEFRRIEYGPLGERLPVLPVIPFPAPSVSKLARASVVAPLVESGIVYLPEDQDWTHDFIEQHARFPNVAHDDMVDTTSMALARLRIDPGARLYDHAGKTSQMGRASSGPPADANPFGERGRTPVSVRPKPKSVRRGR